MFLGEGRELLCTNRCACECLKRRRVWEVGAFVPWEFLKIILKYLPIVRPFARALQKPLNETTTCVLVDEDGYSTCPVPECSDKNTRARQDFGILPRKNARLNLYCDIGPLSLSLGLGSPLSQWYARSLQGPQYNYHYPWWSLLGAQPNLSVVCAL